MTIILRFCAAILASTICGFVTVSAQTPSVTEKATRIYVEKAQRRMTLFQKNKVLRVYKISLGPNSKGAKQKRGDGKTPEGKYKIDWRNPQSAFHLSLHISYPDKSDRSRAVRQGVDPGGEIMIHGLGKGFGWVGPLHRVGDWTDGCIAVTNKEMDEIWKLVPIGIEIEITP